MKINFVSNGEPGSVEITLSMRGKKMNSKEFTRYCGFISLVRMFVVVKIFKFCCFAWNYFQPVNMQYAPKICIYIVFTNDNMFERVVSRFILESF